MNYKHVFIIILYLAILFLLYIILKKKHESFETVNYDDNILLRSNTINIQSLQTNKVNIKDLTFINGRFITKDTIKTLKKIPLKFKDKICIGDTCIDIPHINKLKRFFPYGTIILYKQDETSNDIDEHNFPEGWALCDGNNGTPDLSSKFIIGAGKNYNVGDTGGTNSITLKDTNIPEHSHGLFIPKKGTGVNLVSSDNKFLKDTIINENISGGNGFFIGPSDYSIKESDDSPELELIESITFHRAHKVSLRGWAGFMLTSNFTDKYGKKKNKKHYVRHIGVFHHYSKTVYLNLIVQKDSFFPTGNWDDHRAKIATIKKSSHIGKNKRDNIAYNSLPAHYKLIYLMRIVEPEKLTTLNKPSIKDCSIVVGDLKDKKQILINQIRCLGQTPWI